jgi:hypothetical protein
VRLVEIIGVDALADSNLVIDIHALGFKEEAKRQSRAVAVADQKDDVMEFIEATHDIEESD